MPEQHGHRTIVVFFFVTCCISFGIFLYLARRLAMFLATVPLHTRASRKSVAGFLLLPVGRLPCRSLQINAFDVLGGEPLWNEFMVHAFLSGTARPDLNLHPSEPHSGLRDE